MWRNSAVFWSCRWRMVCFMGVCVGQRVSKNALLDVEANQRKCRNPASLRRRCAVRRPAHAAPGRRARPKPVKLVEYRDGRLLGAALEAEASQPPANCRYIGVFTCKGRRGQNHHRRASGRRVCLMGHDVILLDLDPDQNLAVSRRHGQRRQRSQPVCAGADENQPGATITVLSHAQWQQSQAGDYRDAKVVICDCSPVLAENQPG